MTTLRSLQNAMLPGLFGALLLTPVSHAAPVVAFTGNLSITVAPPPLETNPNLLYPDNTTGNEISLILTDNSNADVRITNISAPTFGGRNNPITAATLSGEDECAGTILAPGGSCGFYIVFDTGNIAPEITQPASIQDSISAIFFTTKTDGVQPFRLVRTYSKTANLTVYDSSISTGDPDGPSAVPEPQACALIGFGLIAIGVAGRRRVLRASSR
jgi:hypothetical protein